MIISQDHKQTQIDCPEKIILLDVYKNNLCITTGITDWWSISFDNCAPSVFYRVRNKKLRTYGLCIVQFHPIYQDQGEYFSQASGLPLAGKCIVNSIPTYIYALKDQAQIQKDPIVIAKVQYIDLNPYL